MKPLLNILEFIIVQVFFFVLGCIAHHLIAC